MREKSSSSPEWIKTSFSAMEQSLNGCAKLPIHDLRKDALEDLSENGFPTTRVEEWKYTNISSLLKTNFVKAEEKVDFSSRDLEAIVASLPEGNKVVFVDGHFSEGFSQLGDAQDGVEFELIGKLVCGKSESGSSKVAERYLGKLASFDKNAFVALNTAFLSDGVFLHVSKDVKASKPFHVVYFSTKNEVPHASHQRLLLVVEDGAELELSEYYHAEEEAQYLNSAVSEVVVGENAKLIHHKLQCESLNAYHVGVTEVRQASGSRYENHAFIFGGKLVRNEINPELNGENIDTVLNGLNVLSGEQHIDNQTVLDHQKPNCESNEWYKGIYDGSSKGNFSGTIIVRQDAQKTNAIQNNQSLLLSRDAESNSKPQLKIWADDVKCTHGATIGQLDDDALFYLRSRGIPEKKAYHVLIRAFAGDLTEQLEDNNLKQKVEDLLLEKLSIAS